ncbi:hypothetical protein DAERI_170041 [Deinococcus aerius]|uniref:Uncharacterized protein n=1 Tax=Deinococcus aerius TaxID=200253 RepID=A0A2I9CZV6_9DEIO|nr:hypothetical protein [Deinococcus aerius]GBF07782.1 hypothetical protein DAERI_170041 [Deinococcus aerius]
MAVILKKNEKVGEVIASLPEGFTEDQFIEKFAAIYPKDWERIEKSYREHMAKAKPGKKQPMPKPEQYLKNALKVFLASRSA